MDAQSQTDAQQHIERCEDVIRRQMNVIREQRAEIDRLVAWIMAETDALTCLQAVYNSPTSTENNRIKAASAALPFERAKLSVSVQVTGPGVLGARLDQTKPPMKTVSPPLIEHVPTGD
jgi:hypothetical protein